VRSLNPRRVITPETSFSIDRNLTQPYHLLQSRSASSFQHSLIIEACKLQQSSSDGHHTAEKEYPVGVEVYVGQLSGAVTEDELRRLFSVAGTVVSVHLVKNSGSGELRGCGYVRMSTEDEAVEAISLLNGAMLADRLITVKDVTKQNAVKSGSRDPGGPVRPKHISDKTRSRKV
jgi:RNA recognition motif-containing protein